MFHKQSQGASDIAGQTHLSLSLAHSRLVCVTAPSQHQCSTTPLSIYNGLASVYMSRPCPLCFHVVQHSIVCDLGFNLTLFVTVSSLIMFGLHVSYLVRPFTE